MSRGPTSVQTAAGLGLLGSLLVALAAPGALADPVVRWWYDPALVGRSADLVLVWAGMILLAGGWWLLGRALPPPRALVGIALLWAVPLSLGPPLFSRDMYSYLAQGTLMHLGHSPYANPPAALGQLGRPHVLAAVSPFWRHTTAPYGPLFLGLVSLIVAGVGGHLVAGVLLVRLLGVLGLAGLAALAGPLCRRTGGDHRRALWLLVLSPLTLLQLIAAGHNDLLMAGLLAAGLAVALSGRPLLGIAICAVAATVKLPALVGALFIGVAWARAETDRAARLRLIAAGIAVGVAALVAISLLTGSGAAWLSSSLFATPARVRLAITPATAVGDTVGQLLRAFGVTTTGRGIEAVLGLVATGLAAGLGIVLLVGVRVGSLVARLAVVLAVAAAAGPASWPWYFVWGLVGAAVLPGAQWEPWLPIGLIIGSLVVQPDGILALPLGSSPIVLIVGLIGLGAVVLRRAHHRRHAVGVSPPPRHLGEPGNPALTGP
jgi:hypothetical protein